MKCMKCGVDCLDEPLYRNNPVGEEDDWRCDTCLDPEEIVADKHAEVVKKVDTLFRTHTQSSSEAPYWDDLTQHSNKVRLNKEGNEELLALLPKECARIRPHENSVLYSLVMLVATTMHQKHDAGAFGRALVVLKEHERDECNIQLT